MKSIVAIAAIVFFFVASCGRAATPMPSSTPSARIVGQWEGQWESGEFISAVTAGEIDGTRYLFLATARDAGPTCEATLRVLDIRDPATPVEIGCLEVPADTLMPMTGLALSGSTLYAPLAGREKGGLWVVDVSAPESPREITLLDTEYLAVGVAVSGKYAYVTTFPGSLLVIDISDSTNPREVGALKVKGARPKVSGSLLYLVSDDGLHVIDVSSPMSLQEVGFYADPSGVEQVPEESGQVPNTWLDRFFDVAVSRQYAYVASGLSGLRVLDMSNPASPQEVAQLDTPGAANGVLVSGGFAYLADHAATKGEPHWSSLRIIDISDPRNPRVVDSVETPGYWGTPVQADKCIYFVDVNSLWVIDGSCFN